MAKFFVCIINVSKLIIYVSLCHFLEVLKAEWLLGS